MVKGKIITPNQQGGRRGQTVVGLIVERMGHLWRPNVGEDAGIDGHIEIRNPKTSEATNLIVQVQVKSKQNHFDGETRDEFEYRCDERDLRYWLGGNCPVVLVMVRLSNEEAFWVNIKDYFKDDAAIRSRKVIFKKAKQRFDKEAADRLAGAAISSTEGYYLPAAPRKENLRCNLLKVRSFGKRLYLADALLSSPNEINAKLRPSSEHPDFDWVLKGGKLLTFHDLRDARWKEIVERGTVEDFATSEWSSATDSIRTYQFVELLKLCLRKKLAPLRTRWFRDRKILYFAANKDGVARELKYRGYKVRTSRLVVSPHMRTDDPTVVSYYLHHAMEFQFLRSNEGWFVSVNPTYHYTSDGETIYRHYEALLKGSSLFDKNQSLSGQTRMWLELLQEPSGAFDTRYPFLTFESPQFMPLSVGFNDKDWLGTDEEEKPDSEVDDTADVPIGPAPRRLFDA